MIYLFILLYVLGVILSYVVLKKMMSSFSKELHLPVTWSQFDRLVAIFMSLLCPFIGLFVLLWAYVLKPILNYTVGASEDKQARW